MVFHGCNFIDGIYLRKVPMKALTDGARDQAFLSRAAQGLPKTITDPAILATVAMLLVPTSFTAGTVDTGRAGGMDNPRPPLSPGPREEAPLS